MNQALKLCALTGLMLLTCRCGPTQPVNLVLITIDTLRADHCSSYGYFRETTPNLDRIAAMGVRFETVYAPMPTTGPTHSSILTSLYPMTHGVVKNGYVLKPSFYTMAELLKLKGYVTAAFVSSYALNSKFGYKQGFDLYDEDFSGQEGTFNAKTWEGRRLEEGEVFDRTADITTERAMAWVKKHAKDKKPFFLWIHYFDPHQPFTPPEEYNEFFEFKSPNPTMTEKEIILYDREIRFADHEMGKLINCIEEELPHKPTLVVATSDHGEGLMDHGRMGHGLLVYEEAVRLPLVMSLKGKIKAGSTIKAPVEVGDIMPTAFDLMGLKYDKGPIHGKSLASYIQNEEEPPYDRLIFLQRRHYGSKKVKGVVIKGNKYSIRQGDWKYIIAKKTGVEELYNLKEDPKELNNLAKIKPKIKQKLAERFMLFLTALKRESKEGLQNISEEDNKKFEALGYAR